MTRSELLAVAKPILFNTEMVTAIIDNRKTTTRRLIHPRYRKDEGGFQVCTNNSTGERWVEKVDENECGIFPDGTERRVYPHYQPGDILYVRETWCWCPCWDCGMNTEKGCCDVIANRFYNNQREETGCYGYRASFETGELPFDNWHPSIHMPKEAARLFLRVTGVRVERLQDITPIGCICEGVERTALAEVGGEFTRGIFHDIWNNTIKPADLSRYGWDTNPWVWAIEFERIEPA